MVLELLETTVCGVCGHVLAESPFVDSRCGSIHVRLVESR